MTRVAISGDPFLFHKSTKSCQSFCMNIHCKYDELQNPSNLKDHPKNRNKHSPEQIERLAQLYEYHGVRHPIIISKLSGCIVAGHGRKQAAIKAGLKEMPVVFQDFENEMAEYAFIQSDNAIALWAELDLSGINADIPEFDPDFNIDMLGIKNFTIDMIEKLDLENTSSELDLDAFDNFQHQCPKCGFEWNDNGTTDGENDEP